MPLSLEADARSSLSSSDVRRMWHFVVSAPLTYSWLIALLITTIVQHTIPVQRLNSLLRRESTNLHHPGAGSTSPRP
jgi:hypothetical protein